MSQLTEPELQYLLKAAQTAALEAGKLVHNFDRSTLINQHKQGGDSLASQVVTQVDFACEQSIINKLKSAMHELESLSGKQLSIAILSEESADDIERSNERLLKEYFWCIDPLDGTLPYIENTQGYAISIALVSQQGKSLIAAVYHPPSKTLYSTCSGQKLQIMSTSQKTKVANDKKLHVMLDRSFKTEEQYPKLIEQLKQVAKDLCLTGICCHFDSGAVMNALSCINNHAACYIKPPKNKLGGGSLWDFAASSYLVKNAGGWASNYYGQPLDLNRADSTFMNHEGVLFASNAPLAKAIMRSCQRLSKTV